MRTKGLLTIVLLLGFLFSVQAADHVKGNGKLSTKKIAIEDYNAIKIDGVIDFNYVQSNEAPFIEVTVDENLHNYVNIDIKNRELTVNFKGAKIDHFTKFIVSTNSKWLKEVKVAGNANFMINSRLSGDELKINANSNCLVQLKKRMEVSKLDLNISGSANMVINELKTDVLGCSINGAGTINLKSGKATQADYSITTDGEIMAYGFTVQNVNCRIAGKGSAQVHATNELKANIVGKGKIQYKGSPTLQQKILGKGSIEKVK